MASFDSHSSMGGCVMTRISGRLLALLAATVFVGGVAQGAIIGTATLIKEPPLTPFVAPDAALPAPWVSYKLTIASDSGQIIQTVQAVISGQLHQRWDDTDFDGDPTNNPTINVPT